MFDLCHCPIIFKEKNSADGRVPFLCAVFKVIRFPNSKDVKVAWDDLGNQPYIVIVIIDIIVPK